MQDQLKSLMEKPLTRREFLSHLGIIMLAVLGLGSLLNVLGETRKLSAGHARHGFGAGRFGI